jgi:epoxyqueuosine reductase QueG
MGLWASWRGALLFADLPAIPRPTAPRPCEACARPCLTACPAGALTAAGYDLDACHAWLDRPEGQDCRAAGCRVRRACPAGAGYGRVAEQSAYHMRRFHP